ARLQQMYGPNYKVENADRGIAWTDANSLLLQRYHLVYGPGCELALGECGYCEHPVAIKREHRLVFGNGLLGSATSAQHLAFGEMCKLAARRGSQGVLTHPFCPKNIGPGRVGHIIQDAAGEPARQPALRLNGIWIECQRPLE